MSFESDALAGLTDAIANMGATWVLETDPEQSFQTVESDHNESTELQAVGGFLGENIFTLHARASDFDTLPVSGLTVRNSSNQRFRVQRVIASHADPGIAIECAAKEK